MTGYSVTQADWPFRIHFVRDAHLSFLLLIHALFWQQLCTTLTLFGSLRLQDMGRRRPALAVVWMRYGLFDDLHEDMSALDRVWCSRLDDVLDWTQLQYLFCLHYTPYSS